MTNNRVQDMVAEAERILNEAKALASEPTSLELSGTISISFLEDRRVVIEVHPNNLIEEDEATPDDGSFIPPAPRTRNRKTEGIINAQAIPEFKGFVLKTGHKTRRASVVLGAYGQSTNVPVPGREVISWARGDQRHAHEVKVELNTGEKVPLDEFVNERFPIPVEA